MRKIANFFAVSALLASLAGFSLAHAGRDGGDEKHFNVQITSSIPGQVIQGQSVSFSVTATRAGHDGFGRDDGDDDGDRNDHEKNDAPPPITILARALSKSFCGRVRS